MLFSFLFNLASSLEIFRQISIFIDVFSQLNFISPSQSSLFAADLPVSPSSSLIFPPLLDCFKLSGEIGFVLMKRAAEAADLPHDAPPL